jgi:hypothetical protein
MSLGDESGLGPDPATYAPLGQPADLQPAEVQPDAELVPSDALTGNDGTMGTDVPAGDAGLADPAVPTDGDEVNVEDLP